MSSNTLVIYTLFLIDFEFPVLDNASVTFASDSAKKVKSTKGGKLVTNVIQSIEEDDNITCSIPLNDANKKDLVLIRQTQKEKGSIPVNLTLSDQPRGKGNKAEIKMKEGRIKSVKYSPDAGIIELSIDGPAEEN